jgi:hypothetical protein
MLDKYDMYGMPVSTERWIDLFEHTERHVGETFIKREIGWFRVSTIWLGLDHNWLGVGPPIIFESMVFDIEGEQAGPMFRYSSLKAALWGHKSLVKILRRSKLNHKQVIHKGGKP